MISPSLFDRIASALFGRSGPEDQSDKELIADVIEMIVDTVEPRVRMHARYREKLRECVRTTIAFLRSVGKTPLPPVLLTRANWNEDQRLNAFFATADDVPSVLGRSDELRAFFDDSANAGVLEAFALLGMKKEEKTIFAPRVEAGILMQEVAQTTVSFTDHRLVAPSATEPQARIEVGRRIIRRLAEVALGRIMALDAKTADLQQQKAYLAARLRSLNLARDGMQGMVEDPATIGEQVRETERKLKEAAAGYVEAKTSLATLDDYIAQIDEVLSHPEAHVALTQTEMRIDRMGVKVDNDAQGRHNALTLAELTVGDNLHGVIALVRCPRSEMPPREDLLANAARYLL